MDGDRPVHVGGGLLVIHAKEEGAARVRNGSTLEVAIPAQSSLIFDTKTGAQLLESLWQSELPERAAAWRPSA